MLIVSFDNALTRANFSVVYFLQFYILNCFDIFQWGRGGGFERPNPPGYATGHMHNKLLLTIARVWLRRHPVGQTHRKTILCHCCRGQSNELSHPRNIIKYTAACLW